MDRSFIKTRLLVHHVSKDRNVETLLKLSNFFNLDEVVMVGRRKMEKINNNNNNNTNQQLKDDDEGEETTPAATVTSTVENSKIKGYKYFREALQDLQIINNSSNTHSNDDNSSSTKSKSTKKHLLIGIEIEPGAVAASKLRETIADKFPECESVTFMPGNEGEGLIESEKECCDLFVYVQQFFRVVSDSDSAGGAGSLNVATSVAVTLSQFFEPSDSAPSAEEQKNHFTLAKLSSNALLLFPVIHFSPEAENSRRVHFLIRPCTAFGANFVSIICPSQKAIIGDKGNRSSFGKNMSSELHCPMESYSSVFQSVRDLKEMLGTSPLIVVGVEISSFVEGDNHVTFQSQLQKLVETVLLPRHQQQQQKEEEDSQQQIGIALLFCDLAFESDGKLSESDKAFCDFIVTISKRQNLPGHSREMNLPCLVSIALHRISVFFGFPEGKQQSDENVFKFSVMLKKKFGDSNSFPAPRPEKKSASDPAATKKDKPSNNKGFELEGGDENEGGFFGGFM